MSKGSVSWWFGVIGPGWHCAGIWVPLALFHGLVYEPPCLLCQFCKHTMFGNHLQLYYYLWKPGTTGEPHHKLSAEDRHVQLVSGEMCQIQRNLPIWLLLECGQGLFPSWGHTSGPLRKEVSPAIACSTLCTLVGRRKRPQQVKLQALLLNPIGKEKNKTENTIKTECESFRIQGFRVWT